MSIAQVTSPIYQLLESPSDPLVTPTDAFVSPCPRPIPFRRCYGRLLVSPGLPPCLHQGCRSSTCSHSGQVIRGTPNRFRSAVPLYSVQSGPGGKVACFQVAGRGRVSQSGNHRWEVACPRLGHITGVPGLSLTGVHGVRGVYACSAARYVESFEPTWGPRVPPISQRPIQRRRSLPFLGVGRCSTRTGSRCRDLLISPREPMAVNLSPIRQVLAGRIPDPHRFLEQSAPKHVYIEHPGIELGTEGMP